MRAFASAALAALVAAGACAGARDRASTPRDTAAARAETSAARTVAAPEIAFPPVGLAVVDSASAWCAEFPPSDAGLATGARVTIVFVEPAEVPAWGAMVVRRRTAACPTAFAQSRWADYVAYDLALIDSLRPDAGATPAVTLAVASAVPWQRGDDGVVRAELDRDGRAEEARVCLADEGQHFTIWSPQPGGGRMRRAHEYFDWGAEVEPNCEDDVRAPTQ